MENYEPHLRITQKEILKRLSKISSIQTCKLCKDLPSKIKPLVKELEIFLTANALMN